MSLIELEVALGAPWLRGLILRAFWPRQARKDPGVLRAVHSPLTGGFVEVQQREMVLTNRNK